MRHMSFALTEAQIVDDSDDAKDVTRRLRWKHARAGQVVMAVRKSQGLKKGEKVHKLRPIAFKRVSFERLDSITPEEVRREGFRTMTPTEFVAFFCKANKCEPGQIVTRIEFTRRVPVGEESGL